MISSPDLDYVTIVDTPAEAFAVIEKHRDRLKDAFVRNLTTGTTSEQPRGILQASPGTLTSPNSTYPTERKVPVTAEVVAAPAGTTTASLNRMGSDGKERADDQRKPGSRGPTRLASRSNSQQRLGAVGEDTSGAQLHEPASLPDTPASSTLAISLFSGMRTPAVSMAPAPSSTLSGTTATHSSGDGILRSASSADRTPSAASPPQSVPTSNMELPHTTATPLHSQRSSAHGTPSAGPQSTSGVGVGLTGTSNPITPRSARSGDRSDGDGANSTATHRSVPHPNTPQLMTPPVSISFQSST